MARPQILNDRNELHRSAHISLILQHLPTVQRMDTYCTVAFNDIKHLARSMPADGLKAQDVVPPRCGCWVARIAIFSSRRWFLGKAHTLARRSGDGSTSSHAAARAGPPRPAFPAFLAGAGRPLPSMIDYSVFSRLAAARGSIISGPVSRSATAFNFRV